MPFKNLKVAFRRLNRNRLHTAIHITGLAISLSASMLLLFWAANEMSFDRFHRKADRIFRINAAVPMNNLVENNVWATTPAPLAAVCKEAVPEMEEIVRVKPSDRWNLAFQYGEKMILEKKFAYADPGFFRMFDFPLKQGNPQAPFPDENSIVLSQKMAEKLFAGENPMGKIVQLGEDKLVVTGVMDNFPRNSTIQAEILFPISYLAAKKKFRPLDTDWGNYDFETYVTCLPTAPTDALNDKLTRLLHEHKAGVEKQSLSLQSLTAIHLTMPNGKDAGMKTVRIFLILAFLILAIACINYVNLSTAQAARRAREVGMRKLIGAGRWQLFGQFMVESGILLGASVALSIVFMGILGPVYTYITQTKLDFMALNGHQLAYGGIMLLIAWLATGVYPALHFSAFQPLKALRGEWVMGRSVAVQNTLVVAQFAFSIAIIMSAFVMNRQLKFMMQKDLGFDRENVLVFPLTRKADKISAFKTEMARISGVTRVATLGGVLLENASSTTDTDWDGCPEKNKLMVHDFPVDKAFFKTLGMKFAEGDDFDENKPGPQPGYVLNEAAVKQMGLQAPVGKRFCLHDEPGPILGVVRDFNFESLHAAIEPAVFHCNPDNGLRLYVKATPAAFDAAIALADGFWKADNPTVPFEYRFLNDTYDHLYEKEKRSASLFDFFAFVTIFISCMGLFGLAVHATQMRTREIGVRKVLGASIADITGLLTAHFIKLVILAILIALPVAIYYMRQWLSGFGYRIDLEWWIFAGSGLAVMGIAFLTVGFQSLKVAMANPVRSLRNE
jgi:putative ABC transport system permease protein